jgi:4'-phosphopantetheinyl transferase
MGTCTDKPVKSEPATPRLSGGANHPPPSIPLNEAEVHVWKVSILQEQSTIPPLFSLLSADERERSARFVFERDRNRFVASRAILRLIIARYRGMKPGEIVLVYDSYGKPSMSPDQNLNGLSFNLAHSGDRAVYALARNVQVGIDIEQQRNDLPVLELAKRFFSPRERRALCSLPEDERREAFFRCWTRKEAYLKALGQGLSVPLERFTVSVRPAESPILLEALPSDDPTTWTILDLPAETGFMAALAVQLTRPKVVFRKFGS